MKLKNFFNIILFSFIMIVTLIPTKEKLFMVPISADFILGAALIVVGFMCIIQMFIKKEKVFMPLKDGRIKFLSVFIIIFTLISIFSVTYAANKGAVVSEVLRFLEYVFIFYSIIILSDEVTIDRALKIFYFTMILACIFGVAQYIFNWSNYISGGFGGRGRIYSTFVNPNYWGAAVNIVIFYPLINLLEKKSINKNFDIAIFILFFFNLFFTSTRGSWLGFALGILILSLIKYRKLIYYFVGIIAAMFIIPMIRNRFFEMLNIQERFKLWETGLRMFKDHFWKGVGNGNYITEYNSYVIKHPELYLGRKKFSGHNSFIKMFAELGIFGGISFIFVYLGLFNLVIKVYKSSIKYKTHALTFLVFGATYLFQNLSNNLFFIPQLNVFVWILAALLFKGLYLEGQGE